MIQLVWDNNNSSVLVYLKDDKTLVFTANAWSRSRLADRVFYHNDKEDADSDGVTLDIFSVINRYLLTLDENTLDRMEQLYLEIYKVLDNDIENINVFNISLNKLISDLMFCINWNHFTNWCYHYGDLNLSIGFKESLAETDKHETTYFTKDYAELVFLSVLLKLIMPIWGMYFSLTVNMLGKERTPIHAIDLIRNDYTENNAAFIKLENHAAHYVEKNISAAGFSIVGDISLDELPEYLLSVALWKKVIICG